MGNRSQMVPAYTRIDRQDWDMPSRTRKEAKAENSRRANKCALQGDSR